MSEWSIDQWVNVASSVLGAVVCAAFVVIYHLLATWWRTEIGRNVMALVAAVGALLLYTVVVSLWPDGCVAMVLRWVRSCIVLAIAAVVAQRIHVLVRVQRESRD
ncbi:hypothetical protein ABZ733_08560 [Streptomyces longwoodensis]|uniref:putative phage holin n=1 Tax=Streptomyces longwoodensis TaxID=68231 RepID=UPI0033C137C2